MGEPDHFPWLGVILTVTVILGVIACGMAWAWSHFN